MSNQTTPTTAPNQNSNRKPIHSIRAGAISVSIWEKPGQDGSVFYTANVQRCYKDKADQWAYSDSFTRDELLTAAKLLEAAWGWITRREAAQRETERA